MEPIFNYESFMDIMKFFPAGIVFIALILLLRWMEWKYDSRLNQALNDIRFHESAVRSMYNDTVALEREFKIGLKNWKHESLLNRARDQTDILNHECAIESLYNNTAALEREMKKEIRNWKVESLFNRTLDQLDKVIYQGAIKSVYNDAVALEREMKTERKRQLYEAQVHRALNQQDVTFYERSSRNDTVALDCEMVEGEIQIGITSYKKVDLLARVSVVNKKGQVLYDTFVKPTMFVTDYRTPYSGVLKEYLVNATDFKKARKTVENLIDSAILVGHDIEKDLKVLDLKHPSHLIRDTQKWFQAHPLPGSKKSNLKFLAKQYLDLDIQGETHCSVEDAKATMALYLKVKNIWNNPLEEDKEDEDTDDDVEEEETDDEEEEETDDEEEEEGQEDTDGEGDTEDEEQKAVAKKEEELHQIYAAFRNFLPRT